MAKRGRKPIDGPESKILQTMALYLEGGKCSSVREAARDALERLQLAPSPSAVGSVVDRLRKAFKRNEPELRLWARERLERAASRRAAPSPSARPRSTGSRTASLDRHLAQRVTGELGAVAAAYRDYELLRRAAGDYDVALRAAREFERYRKLLGY